MNGQQLVATIRSRGGRVALGPLGTIDVDTSPALARLAQQYVVEVREALYAQMTEADLRDEERRWVAAQARIAREDRPFQEIVAELDAAERRAERGGRQ